jgi:carboxylesterase type B
MTDCGVTISVEQGDVCGVASSLPNGQPYHYFKGIPYALPPVGKLRFEPPVPLTKFASPVLDCSKERSRCLQKYAARDRVMGSEDCLFLNVYAPAGQGPYACMVYVHGGGFNTGCGDM